jgi:drug/metabolite transporter (DMT)-like permease
MLGALLATVLFSMSAVSATRTAKLMGGTEANFWRLCLALGFLAVLAHRFGAGLKGDAFHLFILSGCVGFGLGDVALFQALPRIGTRLSVLMVNCLAAPFAAISEWLLMGQTLTGAEVVFGGVILAGVALALAPSEHLHIERARFWPGILWGTVAAMGQAGGVLLSRKAFAVAALAGQNINGSTAAYQRIIGGVAVAGLCLLVVKRNWVFGEGEPLPVAGASLTDAAKAKWQRAWPWLVVNALAGPALGVSCLQWGLKVAPAGIVLATVSLAPLVVIPFARVFENERPGRRSIVGGILAVLAAAALAWVSH